MRFRALLLGLTLVAGCKPDPSESTPTPTTSGGESARPRSGHIDVPDRPAADHRRGPGREDGERRRERLEEKKARREAEMDTDGDGNVSPVERSADRMDRAVTMHHRLDRDHDGKLSPAELGDTKFGRRYNVATIDLNQDGDVSPTELVTAMETIAPPAKRDQR